VSERDCPVCRKNPVLPPNGVCRACYEHLKRNEVNSREQIESHMKRRYPTASIEMLEKYVVSSMDCQYEQWESMTKNGLSAVSLAIIVVDEAKHLPDWKAWHRRRIAFMSDLIALLPDSLFAPVTRSHMDAYTQSALLYWEDKLPEEEREQIYQKFKLLIDKKTNNSTWDEKSLPLWMMQKQDFFDWMWQQFMDCIYECVPQHAELSDDEWMMLYHKHFSDVLHKWVSLS